MFSRYAIDDDLKLMQDYFIVSECGWNSCCHFLIEKCKFRYLLSFMHEYLLICMHEYCEEKAFP
jgi:hypothetical protein